jgi:hypothetical protein
MPRQPTSDQSGADTSSRRDRLSATRRKRRTRIIVAVVVIVIGAGVAAAAYAYNANGSDAPAASPANGRTGKFGRDGTLVPAQAARATAPRKLDHQHPLALWVGGDSLAGSFGPALGDQVGATGVVKTVVDYKVSSGLWSNDIRNWYERATEQMSSDNPDAVVFIIGTNDTPVVNHVDANGDGVPDWEAAYRMKVARMMDLFIGPNHRTVFWLGPPTLGDDSMNSGAKAIGEVMREEAKKREPDVVYLDTYKLFSGPDGGFSRQIVDEKGNEITARISDGTHFTQDGAAYLARAVFTLIDARWKLRKQADPSQPIPWTSAPGSGELVPGYSYRPTSRYQSNGDHHTQDTAAPVVATTFVPQTAPTTFVVPTTLAIAVPTTTPLVTTPNTTAAPPPPPTTVASASPEP